MSDGMKRRDFLKVLGASGAGVATVGCSTSHVDKLIPYVVPAEEIVPGVPTYYASTCRECPAGCGIQVETHEGRVTKVEGTPDHPVSRGKTCARGQASVQGLYHPDRYRGPLVYEAGISQPRNLTWSGVEADLANRIRLAGPGGTVLLSGNYLGTLDRLADDFVAAVGGRRVTYATLENTPRDLDLASADLLVSFGADFLETWGSPVDYAHQFKQMHAYKQGGTRGRFIWVGPHRPLTGVNADLWIRSRPGTEGIVAQAIRGGVPVEQAAREADVDARKLQTAAQWWSESGRVVAMGPGAAVSGRNAVAVRAAVAGLNKGGSAAAGTAGDLRPLAQLVQQMNAGQVKVLLIDAPNPAYALPGGLKFAEALAKVPTRVSFSSFPDDTARLCNYVLPQHHFLEAWDDYLPRAGVADLVQPAMRPVFNTKQVGDVLLALAQRLGVSVAGGAAAGAPVTTYHDYLRAAWAGRVGGEAGWRDALKRGGVFGQGGAQPAADAGPAVAPAVVGAATAAAQPPAPAPVPAAPATQPAAAGPATLQFEGNGQYHLVAYPSYRFYDGRNANRPWLLELPDPVAKVPWDGFVEVHPKTAAALSIKQGDVLDITSPHGSIALPAYIWPGVREDTVAVQMGMGHQEFGRWTAGRGANPMRLLGPAAIDPETGVFAPYGVKVSLKPTGEGNHRWKGMFEYGVRVQHDRGVAQAVSLAAITAEDARRPGVVPGSREWFQRQDRPSEGIEELKGNGGFKPIPRTTDPASYPGPGTNYGQYIEGETRWAMVMDLSRCIGCSACAVACSAENNIPVVGESEMKRGRELSWMRIERYFGVSRDPAEAYADEATDDVRFLPMLCQHCGNAPCEPVCPVYAAYHTPDGLNGQVYNRCVGTRYCANNCPYKVRVFNWFTYEFAEPLNWQLNPDVTVREKGVMEKCTFCVQRIHEKERAAAVEGRHLADGEVVPACAQACPTETIVFGNISDPSSAVARAAASNRGYRVLEELNTQSAIVYLKKVTLGEAKNGGHHDHEVPAPFGGDEHTPQGGDTDAPQGGH